MTDGQRIAAVQAGYQTRVTAFVSAGPGTWELVLRADPRRVYVEFHHQAAGVLTVGPAGIQDTPPQIWSDVPVTVWKFRDCPAMVTGDWYALCMLADTIYAIEQLRVGEG